MTEATYRTGTVSVENGSATVTGDGTQDFAAAFEAGAIFVGAGDDVPYVVAGDIVTNSFSLAAPFAGATASGLVYQVTQDFVTMPDGMSDLPLPRRGDPAPLGAFAEAMRRVAAAFGVINNLIADSTAAIGDLVTDLASKADAAATTLALAGKQPLHALLTSVSALTISAGDMIYGSAADTLARLAKGADGKVLTLVDGLPAWGGRELLTGNRTYFVRPDGSDSNNGLANTSGGAFLTIQKAINTAIALDLGIYGVTINVADGTYTTPVVLKSYLGVGPISIVGNVSSPSSVLLSVTANDVITADAVLGKWQLSGIKLASVTSGHLLNVKNGSIVEIDRLDFGAASGGYYQIFVSKNGSVIATGNYAISGSAAAHWAAVDGGELEVRSRTITLSGTPAFTAFALSSRRGGILALSNTYSGSAIGSRYDAQKNGTIETGGATLPGNAAGTTATGGQAS